MTLQVWLWFLTGEFVTVTIFSLRYRSVSQRGTGEGSLYSERKPEAGEGGKVRALPQERGDTRCLLLTWARLFSASTRGTFLSS